MVSTLYNKYNTKLKEKKRKFMLSSMLNHPKILEINTWIWLNEISRKKGEKITLLTIPEEYLDFWQANFDYVWLMGVWERSPEGRKISRENEDLTREYEAVLKDFSKEDVVGSPYSIHSYNVDDYFGGNEGLQRIHSRLNKKGLSLILDYVPNHLAVDHEWISQFPEMFIQGTEEDLKTERNTFFKANGKIFAHGRDPYFPAWTDTVQINAFSEIARIKTFTLLDKIAQFCEGVRCDMAMLLTTNVFKKTWEKYAGNTPQREFWEDIISKVHKNNPNLIFLAEVYWNLEWKLMQQGFDYCYDKTLYDRLLKGDVNEIKLHLLADMKYQRKLLRFIENHDEKRAYKNFGKEKSKVAALITLTLPGAALIHGGQMQGNEIKVPVQLGRKPLEEEKKSLHEYYLTILNLSSMEALLQGQWESCEVNPIDSYNHSNTNLISYTWFTNKSRILLVINYSSIKSQGHVKIPDMNFGEKAWTFKDLFHHAEYKYQGKDLQKYGLYIDLSPWNFHFFEVF